MANNSALEVEQHGLNVIPESERHGKPRDQFWPWAASNVSIFGISMAAWILGFGLSFGQAIVAGLIVRLGGHHRSGRQARFGSYFGAVSSGVRCER